MPTHDMNEIIGSHDMLWITLDTLRYDVAAETFDKGKTPFIKTLLPNGWQRRHTPGSFTFAAHAAFFAGFLPTPATPGPHPRLFASSFAGSETTKQNTFTFDAPDVPAALRNVGYHTACVGGVGFFNKQTALGSVFPNMFDESHYLTELGVTDSRSAENQIKKCTEIISEMDSKKRLFLFLNISALHQPNCIFTPGAKEDTKQTMANALAYVDDKLPILFDSLKKRGPLYYILMSDHGSAYGEDGFTGHRLSHPTVWEVPYGEGILT